ncbi:MAG: MTH938/NDUFAF3 family protein [Candidimonas sp.]
MEVSVQLQHESNPALNTVTAYGPDYIEINEVAYRHAVYFAPKGDIQTWDIGSPDEIGADMLRQIAGIDTAPVDPMDFLNGVGPAKPKDAPEILLIGMGLKHRMLPVQATQPLLRLGIGVESMTTEAASRTYNILMTEGRRVIAALLPNKEIA